MRFSILLLICCAVIKGSEDLHSRKNASLIERKLSRSADLLARLNANSSESKEVAEVPKRKSRYHDMEIYDYLLPDLESSLHSSDEIPYPGDGYRSTVQTDPLNPPTALLKAFVVNLFYGLPVLFGYFRVFGYLNYLCTDSAVCTNVTVTATSTSTATATTVAITPSVTTSVRVRVSTTTLLETTTSTSMPTSTTSFTETATTSTTSTRTRTNTISTTQTASATFTSTSTTLSITTTTTTFTSQTTTQVNPGGRLIENFFEDEDLFDFEFLGMDTSRLPTIHDDLHVSEILEDRNAETYSGFDNDNPDDQWSDESDLGPTRRDATISSSMIASTFE